MAGGGVCERISAEASIRPGFAGMSAAEARVTVRAEPAGAARTVGAAHSAHGALLALQQGTLCLAKARTLSGEKRMGVPTPPSRATCVPTPFDSAKRQVHHFIDGEWVEGAFEDRRPSGGSKQPGIGREGGVHSLEFYGELRNVCIKL
jgi:hypothetical protein